jgi:hypothetical protein
MSLFHLAQVVLILLAALQQGGPLISAPGDGQTLNGQVAVVGTAAGDSFNYAELAFAYASDPTDTWFTIQTIIQPISGATLADWDTSLLTDGDYRLRLRQYFLDGSFQDFTVEHLRVRNQVALPATTPSATQAPPVSTASALPPIPPGEATELPATLSLPTGALERPTPVPVPTNPAAITTRAVYSFLGRGALLSLILFVVLGLLLRLRRS